MIDLATVYADICRWEGCEPYLYKDDKGLETVGPGFRVVSASAALTLPWLMPDGGHATAEQVSEQYDAVSRAPIGRSAYYYKQYTTMRLSREDCERIALDRLENEFLSSLKRHFPHFDDYPAEWKRALIDIAWNVGTVGILRFHKLVIACEEGNGPAASKEAHTRDIRDDGTVSQHAQMRNTWRASMFQAKYVT